jgi:aspartate aminotransferase
MPSAGTVMSAPATAPPTDPPADASNPPQVHPAQVLGAPSGSSPVASAAPPGTAAPPSARPTPVSATLAANEAIAARRSRGEPVLPLGFGEAGLPAHPALRDALAAATASNGYGPVAGVAALRAAAAGYWDRRGLPTSPGSVVCGPGSKPLLFGLLLAAGADVAVPRPSWVSYAAQASLIGVRAHFVPAAPGEGGICEPGALREELALARAAGRQIRSVVVTLPDNPTGRVARPATVRAFCEVAAEHDLIIISDEIYRDLVHDPETPLLSPAAVAPERTVVTTALSKSFALGGWRIGVARLPEGPLGTWLRGQLVGIGSEIWSAPAAPIQQAAALAFSEPDDLSQRLSASRSLHTAVCRAVAGVCTAAGLEVLPPQAAFYVYPDFRPWRAYLASRHGVTTSEGLARLLLERYGVVTLPGSAFGESPGALRLRLATGLLYGDTAVRQEAALASPDPLALPWVADQLAMLREALADLAP